MGYSTQKFVSGKGWLYNRDPKYFFGAPILQVGQLTIAGVSCEASVQPVHSQAISCSPTPHQNIFAT
jgi:hypothetical protein